MSKEHEGGKSFKSNSNFLLLYYTLQILFIYLYCLFKLFIMFLLQFEM